MYYIFIRSSLILEIQHGTAHPVQNLEKQHLSKNKLYELFQFIPSLPTIRIKAWADNEGGMYFEQLPAYYL